jgi:hypothetical protein
MQCSARERISAAHARQSGSWQRKGNAQAQRDYFKKCVASGGDLDGAAGKSEK